MKLGPMWLLVLALVADSVRAFHLPVSPVESLQVTVAGAGEPVVLLPGLFGSAFGFRALIDRLPDEGYEVIVIEPLGVGSSARPERADYSLTAQADRVARALDALGVSGALVVAHSVGASLALRLAYRRPELVRAVVSLEGGPAEAATTPGFRRAMRFAPWVKTFGGVKLVRRKVRAYLVAASGDSAWVTDAVVDGYTAGQARDLDRTLKAYLAMARAREPERLASHLGEIRCPVRLILGAAPHEGGPSAADVALLSRSLALFAVDVVPAAGHFVHEERPEAVVAVLETLGAAAGAAAR